MGNEKEVFSIPQGRSKDPEYWAFADFDLPEFDSASTEMQKETRSIMAAVAQLHREFPTRAAFTAGEVDQSRQHILALYPHLKPLVEFPEAC